jgi:ribonuclease PH
MTAPRRQLLELALVADLAPGDPRPSGRDPSELRPVVILGGWLQAPLGSALIRQGATWVLCTCLLEERVPQWRRGSGQGWLSATYAMLPGSTAERTQRERRGAGGRTHEIERLVGRSLRGALDLSLLPEWTLHVDCDVLQADGGTRTAAITGSWVAVALAVRALAAAGRVSHDVLARQVAAVSVGVVGAAVLLDLDYQEDVRAGTDMNVVMTGDGCFLEAQATAEGQPFSYGDLAGMLELAASGIARLCAIQKEAVDAHA